jgi:hypothetical protein
MTRNDARRKRFAGVESATEKRRIGRDWPYWVLRTKRWRNPQQGPVYRAAGAPRLVETIFFFIHESQSLSHRPFVDRPASSLQSRGRPRRLLWPDLTAGRLRLDRLPAMAPSSFFPPPASRLCIAKQKSRPSPSSAGAAGPSPPPARKRARPLGGCRSIAPGLTIGIEAAVGAARN